MFQFHILFYFVFFFLFFQAKRLHLFLHCIESILILLSSCCSASIVRKPMKFNISISTMIPHKHTRERRKTHFLKLKLKKVKKKNKNKYFYRQNFHFPIFIWRLQRRNFLRIKWKQWNNVYLSKTNLLRFGSNEYERCGDFSLAYILIWFA